jgi:hypothetical protein
VTGYELPDIGIAHYDSDEHYEDEEEPDDLGPMGTAKVARGRSVHVPTGERRVVDT